MFYASKMYPNLSINKVLHSSLGLIILALPVFLKTALGAKVETMTVSTLLAQTANHLIEALRQEQKSESVVGDHAILPETRGGGGGGYGHGGGGHGHGAITLDPVSIISLLALGAFLINNILQLLRANMGNNNMGGRSLSAIDLETMSLPFASLNGMNHTSEPSFLDFFENVGSLYYLQPKKRQMCMKRVMCNYIHMKESRENNPTNLKSKIFDFMLTTVTKIVAPEMDETDKDERCSKVQKFCSDSLLKDARVSVEYKIYSQVSSWITKLAFNGLASG